MKFKQLEWLSDFILMFFIFVALNALLRLHSVGQPLLGLQFDRYNWDGCLVCVSR
jgi:hypothetical protein